MWELQDWCHTSFSGASTSNDSSSLYSPLNASAIAFHHMVLLLLEDLCYNLNVPWRRPTLILSPPSTSYSNDVPIVDMDIRAQQRHALATEILHLARRSICPDTGMYGTLRFVMPLHVAHDYLIPGSPEMHDLQKNLLGRSSMVSIWRNGTTGSIPLFGSLSQIIQIPPKPVDFLVAKCRNYWTRLVAAYFRTYFTVYF